MIGSDCDNDRHYCHYSVKWLREMENFKKVRRFCPSSAVVGMMLGGNESKKPTILDMWTVIPISQRKQYVWNEVRERLRSYFVCFWIAEPNLSPRSSRNNYIRKSLFLIFLMWLHPCFFKFSPLYLQLQLSSLTFCFSFFAPHRPLLSFCCLLSPFHSVHCLPSSSTSSQPLRRKQRGTEGEWRRDVAVVLDCRGGATAMGVE